MIKFTGKIKREESINGVRKSILKFQNIFISTLLLFPVIYLLFEYKVFKYDEFAMVTGDRVATCKIVDDNSNGYCTAFLVSKNGLLITAGHCLDNKNMGDVVFLTFDKMKKEGYSNIPARIVFKPKDIEADDYAVLQVDKELDIEPLEVAEEIENPDLYSPKVTIIGYKQGKDQDYDQSNIVRVYNRKEDPTTFEINEIFGGMSGGPVIDQETRKVIGIVKNKVRNLSVVNRELSEQTGQIIIENLYDHEGISYCEKIQQVFPDPGTSHINW